MATVTYSIEDAIGLAAGNGNLESTLTGYRDSSNPFFSYHACTPWEVANDYAPGIYGSGLVPVPGIDWRLWNGSDDIVTFLNAQDPSGGWYSIDSNSTYGGHAARPGKVGDGTYGYWLCEVATWMLPYVSGRAYRAADARLYAPVWPGIDKVILGTPVALAPGVSVTFDMHGVIVELTTIPPDMDHIAFDTIDSTYHVGQITFEADESICEDFQFFSFPKQVVCPRRMSIAWKCHLRCALGVEGTITPWRIVGLYGET